MHEKVLFHLQQAAWAIKLQSGASKSRSSVTARQMAPPTCFLPFHFSHCSGCTFFSASSSHHLYYLIPETMFSKHQ
jgi:hypothetical protein